MLFDAVRLPPPLRLLRFADVYVLLREAMRLMFLRRLLYAMPAMRARCSMCHDELRAMLMMAQRVMPRDTRARLLMSYSARDVIAMRAAAPRAYARARGDIDIRWR